MKSKKLLRFYFASEELNRALDNFIVKAAYDSGGLAGGGLIYAERICALIRAKRELGELWGYLDRVIGGLAEEERLILAKYGRMRRGISKVEESERRAIRRAAVKFSRHARRLGKYTEGIRLVGEYYSLLRCGRE